MNGKVNLQLELECEVRDKNGKLISKHRQVSKSLLKNFALALKGIMAGSVQSKNVNLKDTSGTSRAYPYMSTSTLYLLAVNAGQGNQGYGILVGSGTTPVSRDDYKLVSQIAHGSDVGQLSYGAVTVEDPDGTPPDTVFRVIRTFTNNTTESITVSEIGLAFYEYDASAYTLCFLIARDVLSTSQSVPSGATLTVRYIFKVTA